MVTRTALTNHGGGGWQRPKPAGAPPSTCFELRQRHSRSFRTLSIVRILPWMLLRGWWIIHPHARKAWRMFRMQTSRCSASIVSSLFPLHVSGMRLMHSSFQNYNSLVWRPNYIIDSYSSLLQEAHFNSSHHPCKNPSCLGQRFRCGRHSHATRRRWEEG